MALGIILALGAGAAGVAYALKRDDPAPAVVGPAAAAPMGARRILFLGDSLTTSRYWQHFGSHPDWTLTGQGWSGQRIGAVMKQADALLKKTAPTEVVLLAGVNDVWQGRSTAQVTADLAAAWAQLHAVGARVWAVQITPWGGYKGGLDAARQQVTREVNEFMLQQRGQPGGPEEVITTGELGDAGGKLRPELAADGLHLKAAGYKALGTLVERALASSSGAAFGAEEFIPAGWPANWPKAAPAIHAAAHEASDKFGVPLPILYGIMRKESVFNTKLVGYKNATTDPSSKKYSKTFRASYERNKDKRIPGGGGLTWGQMFTPDQWTAWGVCQLLPFNIVGKRYGVKAGAPLSSLYDVRAQLLCAGELLKALFDKHGDWETAVLKYNGARSYLREVLAFAEEFKAAQA
jgi:lysophospholipase L1-like esterase